MLSKGPPNSFFTSYFPFGFNVTRCTLREGQKVDFKKKTTLFAMKSVVLNCLVRSLNVPTQRDGFIKFGLVMTNQSLKISVMKWFVKSIAFSQSRSYS